MSQRRTRILLKELVEIPVKNYTFDAEEEKRKQAWEKENAALRYNELRPINSALDSAVTQSIEEQIAALEEIVVEMQLADVVTGSYEVRVGDATTGLKPISVDSIANKGIQRFTLQPSTATREIGLNLKSGTDAAVKYLKAYKKEYRSYELDLYDEESIGLNIARLDRSNVAARAGSYTKTITLPATKNNNKIFSHLYDINVYNPTKVFSRAYDCQLQVDDDTLVQGQMYLLNCNYTEGNELIEYDIQIVSSVSSLSTVLGNKKLVNNSDPSLDLDFSKHDHKLLKSNIIASWTAPTGSGYYYPLIDAATNPYSIRTPEDFRPVPYAKEIVDKIFEGAGYTYTSEFFNSNMFQNLVILNGNPLQLTEKQAEQREFLAGYTTDTIPSTLPWCKSTHNGTVNNTQRTITVAFPNDSSTPYYDNGMNFSTSTGGYTVPNKGNYTFTANIIARFTSWLFKYGATGLRFLSDAETNGLPYFTWTIEIVKNAGQTGWNGEQVIGTTTTTQYLEPSGLTTNNRTGLAVQSITTLPAIAIASDVELKQDDVITTRIRINNFYTKITSILGDVSDTKHAIYLEEFISAGVEDADNTSFGVDVLAGVAIAEGDIVPMSATLPQDMTQIEFISNLTKMFNLVFDDDPSNQKNLIIEPMIDYVQTGETIDWTLKEDLNSQTTIERIDTVKDSNIYFSYQEGEDEYNKLYFDKYGKIFGEKYIPNSDAEPNNTQDITLSFAPTPSAYWKSTGMIVPNLYDLDNESGEIRVSEWKDRILFRNGLKPIPSSSYGYKFVTTTESTTRFKPYLPGFNQYPVIHHTDDINNPTMDLNFAKCNRYYHNFGTGSFSEVITDNNLYSVYWKSYINRIIDPNSKKVTKTFKLDPSDISNFRFSNKYFVDNQYYTVNRIIDYDPVNSLTQVELYKLTDYDANATNTSVNSINDREIEWQDDEAKNNTEQLPVKPGITEIVARREPSILSGSIATERDLLDRLRIKNRIDRSKGIVIGELNSIEGSTGVFVLGRDVRVKDNTVDITIIASSGSVVEDSVEGGTIISSPGSTITAGSKNVTIIGGDKITNTENNEVILGGRTVFKKEPIIFPDVLDGGLDEVQNPFSPIVINIMDGGLDSVRPLGSFTTMTLIDGGLISNDETGI